MEDITIPEGIISIEAYAFAKCVYLNSVKLPSTLENVEVYSFAYCQNLASVSMPASVRIIGNGAFGGCSKLSTIEIPNSVVYIGSDAFANTAWLKARANEEFIVAGDGVLVQYNGKAENIVIPDTVKRIPAYRFATLSVEPKSFTVPSSVQYISVEAFSKMVQKSDSYSYERRYTTIIGEKGSYAEIFANHEYYTFKKLK